MKYLPLKLKEPLKVCENSITYNTFRAQNENNNILNDEDPFITLIKKIPANLHNNFFIYKHCTKYNKKVRLN